MLVMKIIDMIFNAIKSLINLLPKSIVTVIAKPEIPLPLKYGS